MGPPTRERPQLCLQPRMHAAKSGHGTWTRVRGNMPQANLLIRHAMKTTSLRISARRIRGYNQGTGCGCLSGPVALPKFQREMRAASEHRHTRPWALGLSALGRESAAWRRPDDVRILGKVCRVRTSPARFFFSTPAGVPRLQPRALIGRRPGECCSDGLLSHFSC